MLLRGDLGEPSLRLSDLLELFLGEEGDFCDSTRSTPGALDLVDRRAFSFAFSSSPYNTSFVEAGFPSSSTCTTPGVEALFPAEAFAFAFSSWPYKTLFADPPLDFPSLTLTTPGVVALSLADAFAFAFSSLP